MHPYTLHQHLTTLENNCAHLKRLLGDGAGEAKAPPDPVVLAKVKTQLLADIDALRPELEAQS